MSSPMIYDQSTSTASNKVTQSNSKDEMDVDKWKVRKVEGISDKRSKLIIKVLSMHELPIDHNDTIEPQNVTLEALGKVLEIGPPLSRHKQKSNNFKYFKKNKPANNEFVILAPLSSLYQSILKFNVILVNATSEENKSRDNLSSDQTDVSQIVSINQSKSFIIPLNYDNKISSRKRPLNNEISSTLRINVRLETISYRTEIKMLQYIFNRYFQFIDTMHPFILSMYNYVVIDILAKYVYPSISKKLVMISFISILVFSIVTLPIITLLMVLGFPILLPIIILLGCAVAFFLSMILVFHASTKPNRVYIHNNILYPTYSKILSTSLGQQMIYDTGPRPTPKQILTDIFSTNNKTHKLYLSLLIDIIGSSSYIFPIIGESMDTVWAPMQSYCVFLLYDDCNSSLKYISFVEEILPFTDIFPTATIGWLLENYYYRNNET